LSKSTKLALVLCLAGSPAFGGTLLFQGAFADDTGVALINLTLNTTQTLTIQSYGYAGGIVPTSPSTTDIPAGGFAPNVIIFDAGGNQIGSDNGGHCGTTGQDPVTNNCSDPFFQQVFAGGSYTVALVEWDNVSNGLLSDGFKQDGNPGFTCGEFGLTGNFCDTTTAVGTLRNENWALAISGTDFSTAVPEPGTFLLGVAGCFVTALVRRRLQRNS
jgi:hypothetical protein